MPERISRSVVLIAFVAALVVGASVDLRTDKAYANDCLAAPNASAPQRQHWYYRIDRPNHRKCWYLHAALPLPHRAMVRRVEHHRMSTATSVPMPESVEDGAPSPSQAGTAAAKPQFVSFANTMTEEPGQQSASEESDPSTPREAGAQPLGSDAPIDKSDDPGGAAGSSEPTGRAGAAGPLLSILILLVPALAIAGFVIPILIKMFGERRVKIPETAWIDYRVFEERLDLQTGGERRADRQRLGFADPGIRKPVADRKTRRFTTRSQDPVATSAKLSSRDVKDIERALRVIKQARQSETT
jgi:hypothetical protein